MKKLSESQRQRIKSIINESKDMPAEIVKCREVLSRCQPTNIRTRTGSEGSWHTFEFIIPPSGTEYDPCFISMFESARQYKKNSLILTISERYGDETEAYFDNVYAVFKQLLRHNPDMLVNLAGGPITKLMKYNSLDMVKSYLN